MSDYNTQTIRTSESLLDVVTDNGFDSIFPTVNIDFTRFISELLLFDTILTDGFLPETFNNVATHASGGMELLLFSDSGERLGRRPDTHCDCRGICVFIDRYGVTHSLTDNIPLILILLTIGR